MELELTGTALMLGVAIWYLIKAHTKINNLEQENNKLIKLINGDKS